MAVPPAGARFNQTFEGILHGPVLIVEKSLGPTTSMFELTASFDYTFMRG